MARRLTIDLSVAAAPGVLPEGSRVYAIGDIHGHRDLLDTLLDRIAAHAESAPPAHKTLVFLGDYIDRGPDTRGVLDRLISPIGFADSTVFLRGNHEQVLLNFMADPVAGIDWATFGAPETLASYGIDPQPLISRAGLETVNDALADAMPPAHVDFLTSLKFGVVIGGYIFVHAGIKPSKPLAHQDADDLIWIRGEFMKSNAEFGAVVVHGHTPLKAPEIRPNRISIDTAAFSSGCLTCAILEGAHLWLLDTVKKRPRQVY